MLCYAMLCYAVLWYVNIFLRRWALVVEKGEEDGEEAVKLRLKRKGEENPELGGDVIAVGAALSARGRDMTNDTQQIGRNRNF